MSYAANIAKVLGKLGTNGTTNPDAQHNVGHLLGQLFMWRQVLRHADGQVHNLEESLQKEGIFDATILPPGEHAITESPHFSLVVIRTAPRRSLDEDALAEALHRERKVPLHVTKELIAKAKLPKGKGATTIKVMERV